ncbi:MAG: TipAS antibiotic-recognition domain-containing protein, partial [Cytophagales bacterium]|nr:TipAS antibiotic-recognition domain-containing protein [Cytophagales bacterium]
HHRHLNFYYEVDEERYRGLGKMYVEDQRFNDYYEKYRQGLANFLQKAINVFCDNGMVASKK